jgi:hypothetical protein
LLLQGLKGTDGLGNTALGVPVASNSSERGRPSMRPIFEYRFSRLCSTPLIPA